MSFYGTVVNNKDSSQRDCLDSTSTVPPHPPSQSKSFTATHSLTAPDMNPMQKIRDQMKKRHIDITKYAINSLCATFGI